MHEATVYVYPRKIDKIKVPTNVDPRTYVESKLMEQREKEPEPELDPAEAKRLANWRANFPYKPTTDTNVVITDTNVVITERMLESGGGNFVFSNHDYLRSFFESEARFTPQFEQLYRILEKHGRGDNPIAAGRIYNCLWQYHRYR